ncbi:hypothetical protein [Cohnella sp.]|uniref:hypothetical protein n=1 Tax=Cohnella sp. TaxID=1883426 RepID=UPI00356AC3C2
MTNFEYKRIKLTNLLVNTENYRFDPVGSQIEAIQVMVRDQNSKSANKLYNLAIDILENGLNPSDLTVVSPYTDDESLFVVHEGNRRITTLKLLFQPDLIPQEFRSLQNKFRELHVNNDLSQFEELLCVVYNTYEEADHWIEIKHTGEMDGVGTVRWDTEQQERFKANTGGSKSAILQTLELVEQSEHFEKETKENAQIIGVTNLERLISDPDVRSFLGIKVKNNEMSLEKPEQEVAKGLTKIINDLSSKKIIVNDIYYKKDRLKYLDTFEDNEIPQDVVEDGERAKVSDVGDTDKGKDKEKPPLKPKRIVSRPVSKKRKNLIPTEFVVRPKDDRVNNIYRELKQLEVEKFTNSASVMLRVFIELSIDYYLSINPISGVDASKSLNQKLSGVIDYLEKSSVLTRKELQGARYVLSSKSVSSTENLNAYVHSRLVHPSESEIKTTWDNIALFIKTILAN